MSAFWTWFVANERSFRGLALPDGEERLTELERHLRAVHDDLRFQVSETPGLGGARARARGSFGR